MSYYKVPGPEFAQRSVRIPYVSLDVEEQQPSNVLEKIMAETPKPKGRDAFTSVHVISVEDTEKSATVAKLSAGAKELKVQMQLYTLPELSVTSGVPMAEYEAIFELASSLIENKADRASLIVFVGSSDIALDAYAVFIGMLPFRGVTVALVSQRAEYGNLNEFVSASNVFQVDTTQAQRLGLQPIAAVFGKLDSKTLVKQVQQWQPVDVLPLFQGGTPTRLTDGSVSLDDEGMVPMSPRHSLASTPVQGISRSATPDSSDLDSTSESDEGFETMAPVETLPFKIGGLDLPMVTHNGTYHAALKDLGEVLEAHYKTLRTEFFPIVSCGETCDALGYGADTLQAVTAGKRTGYLFAHLSGETYKRYDNFGSEELFQNIQQAKRDGKRPVILAVGGGVNGNSIGLIAGITGCDFIEVPTTPMHYNDATTSAKQAVSLVKNDVILSKNILGAFYLPTLVFCVSEMFLTINSANCHATVGEACKTMNMLGVSNSDIGAKDYHDIEGAVEFASDFTKMLKTVTGFERLIKFITNSTSVDLKQKAISYGQASKEALLSGDKDKAEELLRKRKRTMALYRKEFSSLPDEDQCGIKEFLSTVNYEVVSAKAMFLAYSDPFEKFRALLFEYAHTLGHGIEAFANGMYTKARKEGIEIPERCQRLHGQCVGMAVQWAGQMSNDLGLLSGEGLTLHQSFVFLFNRFGGFTFAPLRELAEKLNISKEELTEGVLKVVRRDNKRGYCKCSSEHVSVDQLVKERPGRMLKSEDPAAALRYLVEVDESIQAKMLNRAWDGEFDKVADIDGNGKLSFVPFSKSGETLQTPSKTVANHIHRKIHEIYSGPQADWV